MKKALLIGGSLIGLFSMPSCKKKESGICYCHYYGGNKRDYDLTSLPRSKQIDSCYVLDGLASGFAGDCDLQ